MKIVLLLATLIVFSCQQKKDKKIELQQEKVAINQKEAKELAENLNQAPSKKSAALSVYHSESFETPNVGWGYSIFEGTKEIIHQPHIPAIQGNQGFATKEISERVAKEIIRKLDLGIMPPTLSVDEMQKLGAI